MNKSIKTYITNASGIEMITITADGEYYFFLESRDGSTPDKKVMHKSEVSLVNDLETDDIVISLFSDTNYRFDSNTPEEVLESATVLYKAMIDAVETELAYCA